MTTLLKELGTIGNTALKNEKIHYMSNIELIQKEQAELPAKDIYLFGQKISIDPIQEQELLLNKKKNIIDGYQIVAKKIKAMFKDKGLSEPAVIPMNLFKKICNTCELTIMKPPKEGLISKMVYYELLPILLYKYLATTKNELIIADIKKYDIKAANSFDGNILGKEINLGLLTKNEYCYEDRNREIIADIYKKIHRIVQKHIRDAFEELDINDVAFLLCNNIAAFDGKSIHDNAVFSGVIGENNKRSGGLHRFLDGKWMQYVIEFEPLSQKEQHLLLDLSREFPENSVHIAFDKKAVKNIKLRRDLNNELIRYTDLIPYIESQETTPILRSNLINQIKEKTEKFIDNSESLSLEQFVNSIKNDFYNYWKKQPDIELNIDQHIANHQKQFEEKRNHYLKNITACDDAEIKHVFEKRYLNRDELRTAIGNDRYEKLIDPIFFMPWHETHENRDYELAIVYLHTGTLPNEEKAMELIKKSDHSVFLGVQSN